MRMIVRHLGLIPIKAETPLEFQCGREFAHDPLTYCTAVFLQLQSPRSRPFNPML